MRKVLIDKYPEEMATNNIGWKPNDALYHAEATALFRAARENGGSLYGRTINLYGDREICGSCDIVLPLLSRELGNPTISFRDFKGNRSTLRNGF